MVKRKNPFAIDKNGNLIYIKNKDYEHKKQYKECYCAKCNELLIPKMGDKNIWHFSHKNNTNCDGSYETNLHKYAKEIIKNNTKIELPKLKLSTYMIMRNFLIKEREISFISKYNLILSICNKLKKDNNIFLKENVYNYIWNENEKKIINFIPDCLICIKDKLLCVELKVTHGCDEEKINKVKNLDIDMIEIDLSDFSEVIGEVDLEEFVLYKAQRKWIHKTQIAHKEEEIFKNIIYDKNNKKIEILRDFCPNCGEIYSAEDFENIFLINTIGMDRDCIKNIDIINKNIL